MSTTTAIQKVRSFDAEVIRTRSLSPHLRRITFASEDLRSIGADAEGRTLDLRIKVMIPSPGHPLPDIASLMSEGTGWYQRWREMPVETRGCMRTYTVRERRLEAGEIDVDFVLHPPVGGAEAGPAAEWAAQAQVGEWMTLIGPNLHAGPCLGIEFKPGGSQRLLLVGDETAVPAIAAILESLGSEYTGHVILEVPDAEDFIDLTVPPGVEVTWLARGEQHHGVQLNAAVRSVCPPGAHLAPAELAEVDIDHEILWETPEYDGDSETEPGALYAWIAGEAGAVKELRRYLVREVGMDRKRIAFMGYWRIGKSESL